MKQVINKQAVTLFNKDSAWILLEPLAEMKKSTVLFEETTLE
jgi:hypothetical protein